VAYSAIKMREYELAYRKDATGTPWRYARCEKKAFWP
jgi:hypothetical protein